MKKFIDYSKNIGQDFMLCQGPGGNTSFKVDNTVYIKKSGLHLSKATKDTFQKIEYSKILNFYQSSKKRYEKFDKKLSIETPLHVLSTTSYIFHYHSIASIICSAIFKQDSLNKLLLEEKILPVRYLRPGLSLALEIKDAKNKKNFSSVFLHNHGMVVEGTNLKEVYEKIYEIEDFFKTLIDYPHLIEIKNNIIMLRQENLRIKNPNSEIEYEKFNEKFLFPDHAVFFPFPIDKNKNSPVYYDEKYIYFDKKLSETELIYFKTLLIIFNYIKKKEILNYIDQANSADLRNSKDEKLRQKLNK